MPGDVRRYQLDYILVRQRYRNSVKNCHACPGADVNSDHNLVRMKVQLRFKKIQVARREPKLNLEKLKVEHQTFNEKVKEKLANSQDIITVNDRWICIRSAILSSAKETLGVTNRKRPKKPWVTLEMLEAMDERRKWKNVNTIQGQRKYKTLNNKLRKITDKARDEWWRQQCQEMEELERSGKHDLLYKKVRELTGDHRTAQNNTIKNKNGDLLTEPAQVQSRWKEYIEELYAKDKKPVELPLEDLTSVDYDNLGPDLLDEEIEIAIRELKSKKAAGIDGVTAELLKALDQDAQKEIKTLCRLIYQQGEWPEEFTQTVMIPLQKKPNAQDCKDHRTISLISHASKIVLKIINKRIQSNAENYVGSDQFGFKSGCGTREAIALMRIIVERSLEMNGDVFACFVDFEKAFDRVCWPQLMDVLKGIGVDWRIRQLVTKLYMSQSAVIQVAGGTSEEALIGRGVRQGCIISPLLFNIYAEAMLARAWEKIDDGVRIGGRLIQAVRFADDKALISNTEEGLQRLVETLHTTAFEFGMKINIGKTKVMKFSRQPSEINIALDGTRLDQVDRFKYLGSTLTADGKSSNEIKTRIAMAKTAFVKRRELWMSNIPRQLKKRLIKSLIWSVALYAAETWTLRGEDVRRLESFEMWIWRKIEKVSWMDRKTNDEVLKMAEEKRLLIDTIRKRKKNWMGHILRRDSLINVALEGRMEGKRSRGRQRVKMMDDILAGFKCYQDLKNTAQDRALWRHFVRS